MSKITNNYGKDCRNCKHHLVAYNKEPCWTCINSGIMNRVKFEPKGEGLRKQ